MKVLSREESKKLGDDDQWLLGNNSYRAYHIVDGQQRLITFVILLNEILEFTMSLPEYVNTPEAGVYLGYESIKDIRAKFISRQMPPDGLVTTYLFDNVK